MISKWTKVSIILTFLTFLAVSAKFSFVVRAQSDERLTRLNEQIEQYQKEIVRLRSQAATLSNQIAQFNTQIKLTLLKITETEEKIALLGGRIDQLEESLNALSKAFSSRIVEIYKMGRLGDPFLLLISAPDLSGAVSRYHYLQKIQRSDQNLLSKLEEAQRIYKAQRTGQEELQAQLERQKTILDSQKKAKAELLSLTKNDERRYQELLAAARAEFEAIQAVIAGKGDETQVGSVSEGQRIASIIGWGSWRAGTDSRSCNSSGAHLHFIISQNGNTQNPFNYLGGIDYENCSGSSCGSGGGDSFSPSGSWSWPINPKIKFSQGYGSTWAIANTWVGRIYNFHNGIDINSDSSSEVKTVKSGTLYRGSYGVGCQLRYVRVDHDDSDLDIFYLHVDY